MKVHVIHTATTKIDWEYDCWIHEMKKKHLFVDIKNMIPHTYEDRDCNRSVSSLLITYETHEIGE